MQKYYLFPTIGIPNLLGYFYQFFCTILREICYFSNVVKNHFYGLKLINSGVNKIRSFAGLNLDKLSNLIFQVQAPFLSLLPCFWKKCSKKQDNDIWVIIWNHLGRYVKSVSIRSFSSPCFPTFGLNTERKFVPLRIQSEYGKIRTRKTPNTETFYAVDILEKVL